MVYQMARKPPWFYNQSGVIPFRMQSDVIEILLITSKRRKRWIIPKGIIEQHVSPQESAAKEALEEAGVRGRVHATPIGEYEYDKWHGTCKVKVFPMEVTEILGQWLESGFRHRKWVSPEEAAALVDEPELKQIIRRIPDVVHTKCET